MGAMRRFRQATRRFFLLVLGLAFGLPYAIGVWDSKNWITPLPAAALVAAWFLLVFSMGFNRMFFRKSARKGGRIRARSENNAVTSPRVQSRGSERAGESPPASAVG